MYVVPHEQIEGAWQGGMCALPLPRFPTGVMRGRFHSQDGQLYCCGMFAWAGDQTQPGGFYRVRYTGKKANIPIDLRVSPGTIRITFSDPLDRSTAEDADSYSLQQWNYRWTENNGSPHYKVSDPKKTGHDDVEVQSAALSQDGRTVTLKIDKLQPVMQMKIGYNLKAADGAKVQSAIYNTINVVGDLRAELRVGEFRVVPK